MEKFRSDLEDNSLPRRQPPYMASRLMRNVSKAVSGSGNSEDAAPMPAAALSAERAKPRESASTGERTSTSSQLASLIVFLRELSKIFTRASANNMAKERKEVTAGGMYALKRAPMIREEIRSKSESAATITADTGGIFTLSAPYAKPAVKASAERAMISSMSLEIEKNKCVHLPFMFDLLYVNMI